MGTDRSLDDRFGGIRRQLVHFIAAVGYEDPVELLKMKELQEMLEDGLGDAVRKMRTLGHSDADIGLALGVSRAAVSKRWPGDGRYVGAAGRYRKWGDD